jgi:hypothetical protein
MDELDYNKQWLSERCTELEREVERLTAIASEAEEQAQKYFNIILDKEKEIKRLRAEAERVDKFFEGKVFIEEYYRGRTD